MVFFPLSTRVPPVVETEPFAAVVIEGKSKGRVMSLREAVWQAIVCELDAVIIMNHGWVVQVGLVYTGMTSDESYGFEPTELEAI